MKKSLEKISSDKSSSISENLFSFKRYFLNNLDSYHGEYILKELSKILEKNAIQSSRETSQTIMGEDAEPVAPQPPKQPYEIIGTVTDQKIKSLDNISRIVSKTECLPLMLTCGTVILDISCDRNELKFAMDYIKPKSVVFRLLETLAFADPQLCSVVEYALNLLQLKGGPYPSSGMSYDLVDDDFDSQSIDIIVLKDLLDKQASATAASTDVDDRGGDAGGVGEAKKRYLILISSVMTWAATKPLDPDTPDMPFIETDFRKRKPHPNYKMHYDIENEVISIARKYKSYIGALVVTPGVTYGGREDVLFYWFQKAWECERLLPILGHGGNVVPLINVLDLAQVIYNLVTDFPKKLYILAVEQMITKQREIVKPLGRSVGSGMFKCIPPEDAFLIPEIDQRIFDLMTLNLNMEPTYIVETMGLQWTSELSFAENVHVLIKQYKKERGLKPFKVVVYGPPVVGKTTLSKLICEAYGLVYISPETVADDILDDLTWRVHHWDIGETALLVTPTDEEQVTDTGDDDDMGADEGDQEAARITLGILESGRPLTEEDIMSYLRQRLLCREALNKGWVLDGFPMNLSQCAALFDKGEEQDSDVVEEDEEEQFDEDVDLYSNVLKKILPSLVVSLEATDDFICEKAMRQPEGDSRLDEEIVLKRLSEFRAGDARDVTPLNFFDELDIHPLVVPVKEHNDYGMKGPYAAVALRMGRPCRYGKLIARIEAAEKREREELETLRTKEKKAQEGLEKKLKEEREEKMEYWSELYALMRDEEEAALAAASEPMRNYLINHIFPTLTPALLEVAKLRPEDPVDFLAEYLFKLNPSGKMLEPGYNLQAEKLLGKIKILDEALKGLDIKIDPLLSSEADADDVGASRKAINSMSAL